MKDLARAISRAGTITGHWKGDNFPWTLESATILFHSTLKYFEFPSRINGHKKRFEHMSWKSIHNLYLRNKKNLVGEVPVDTQKKKSTKLLCLMHLECMYLSSDNKKCNKFDILIHRNSLFYFIRTNIQIFLQVLN